MKKVMLETFLGLVLSLSGFYIGFIYLKGIQDGTSPLLLIVSIVCIGIGIFFLLRAGKSGDSVGFKTQTNTITVEGSQSGVETIGSESVLERNNEYMAEWSKTNRTRDELKVLQMSAAAEESTK